MTGTKICAECGRDLPLTEYNKHTKSKDGLQQRCRECFSRYNKIRYQENKDKVKAAVKKYREENPDKVYRMRVARCEKAPTRMNANKVIESAVKSGVVENPGVCFGCGCKAGEHRIEAHHHDYSKPLDVVWLCTPCHRRMDAQRRTREGKKPYGRSA